jgi:hypothetical protein
LTVVLLIDALGWEIVREFGFGEEMFSRRTQLGTVLGYSSAAIPSLLSGTTPAEHGSWAMYRLAAGRSPFGFLKILPQLPHAIEWRLRRLARRITDRRGVIRGYYDLYDIPLNVLGNFDVAQHQDPYVPGGLSRDTVFDDFVADGIPYRLWYYRTPEQENMDALVDAVGQPYRVLFLYTAELDALMHRVGIFDETVAKRLERYQRFLERVVEACGRHGREVDIHVLSDHGMTNVTRSVDLWGELEKRGRRLGRDYLAFYDSTMARMWCDEGVAGLATTILADSDSGRLLLDEELAAYGCRFDDARYGRSVFLANPGVMIVPSFMGREQIGAMHGYDPDDRFSLGCFLSTDAVHDPPVSILDFRRYLLGATLGDRE